MLRNMLIDEQELYKVYVLISSHKAKSKIEPLRFKQTHQDMEMEILETRSNDGRELRFFVLGCQGNGLESQRRVAALMNEYIKNHPDKRPDFILLAGDNIYECGPDSPTDPGFKNCFENATILLKAGSVLTSKAHDYRNKDNDINKWTKKADYEFQKTLCQMHPEEISKIDDNKIDSRIKEEFSHLFTANKFNL